MNTRWAIALFVFMFGVAAVWGKATRSKRLPDEFPRCKLNQTDYNSCLKRAIEQSFVLLGKGIPSLGVLPIEPMEITQFKVRQGTGNLAITMTLNRALISGFSNVKILSASDELARGGFNMRCESMNPEVQMLSDYNLDGRILLVPIRGAGKGNLTMRDVRVSISLENELVTRNGEEFIKINKFNLKLRPKKINYELGSLFKENPEIARQMSILVNDNALELFNEMSPVLEESFGEIYKEIANKIFLNVPYKTMFLH